ncbi:MAG TPA: chromate efflux transporter [Anaeromyxobacteraceae bacterium]|nr:chromate efflux transporter [Anaeromyxobacteraceae bacterium]
MGSVERPPRAAALRELAVLFGRLGATAFGGPAAHVALMEDEVVRRRGWLTRAEFLDLLGAANLIPGPNSTEMAIHVGYRRAGLAGLAVAGTAFILPAAVLVAAIAWAYVRFGTLPAADALLRGVKPVVVAVVVQALIRFARTAIRTRVLAGIACAALAATLLGVDELVVLGAGGAVAILARPGARASPALAAPLLHAAALGAAPAAAPALAPIFLVFAKIGSVLFGSGYVLLAFLRTELVERRGWLSEGQLLDAVAVGQVTPGPLFTTATFVGYLLRGFPGAAAATLGIFLPAFVFVAASGPLVPRIRRSAAAGAFLDGVNVASLALMAAVTLQLARAALTGWTAAALAVASAVLLARFRVNSTWLVLGGAAAGLLLLRR